MSRPIPSTRGVYLPGVGRTITHANIADEQKRRVKAGQDPAEPKEIVEQFCKLSSGEFIGEHRHLARAMRLMKNG